MRLAFPSAGSVGLWELVDLNTAESEAEAEEGCRLVYVAASRAEDRLDPQRALQAGGARARRASRSRATRRCAGCCRRSRERGFDGADGEVELPGPPPVGGAGAAARRAPADPRQRAGRRAGGRAGALVPGAGRGRPAGDARASPPPLLDPSPGPVPIGHLSYSALVAVRGLRLPLLRRARARGPRVARRVRRRGRRGAARAAERAGRARRRPRARRSGSATPSTPRSSGAPGGGWERPPAELIGDLLAREGLGERARPPSAPSAWSPAGSTRSSAGRSPARQRAPRSRSCSTSAPTVARGQIDLLVAGDGVPTVVDYKTDALDGRAPPRLGEPLRGPARGLRARGRRRAPERARSTSSSRRRTSR